MFKKLKNIEINFALIVFIAFSAKMIAFNATFADSIIVGVLAGLYGYTQYLKRFQPFNLDEAVQKDLQEVKVMVSKMNLARTGESLKTQKYF